MNGYRGDPDSWGGQPESIVKPAKCSLVYVIVYLKIENLSFRFWYRYSHFEQVTHGCNHRYMMPVYESKVWCYPYIGCQDMACVLR